MNSYCYGDLFVYDSRYFIRCFLDSTIIESKREPSTCPNCGRPLRISGDCMFYKPKVREVTQAYHPKFDIWVNLLVGKEEGGDNRGDSTLL